MKQDISFLIERKNLLKNLSKWRIAAVVFLALIIITNISKNNFISKKKPYIAKVKITGMINDDDYRINKLNMLKNSDNVEAVIIKINSPGGTFVGGERLYNTIKKISKKKPVIAIIGDQATSAAYLAAIGSDYIIASNGSLTGSVGVLLQAFEATNLAEKIGIKPIIIKSSSFKATPHPAEKFNQADYNYLSKIVSQSKEIFLDIVKSERENLNAESLKEISLGKVFIGKQAKELNLIDAIGDEKNALDWLKSKNINNERIINIKLQKPNENLKKLFQGISNINFLNEGFKLYSIL
ncbi:MAG: signal peptide peptidase SppA [Rickettsiales bacterium]|nr:signal peptide peptidase SppA [Rickettsiales bacterium]